MYESSLIIVTGDHGEMLGEHGETTHMYFIYQSAMKVPLVVKLPRSNTAHSIDDLASIIDIVPTVCELLDIDPPAGIQGKSLVPYFSHQPPRSEDRVLYCESLFPTKYKANSLLGLISKRWKYIQTTRPELYDLWAECLMRSVKEYDPEYSEETERVWREVIAFAIEHMKVGY